MLRKILTVSFSFLMLTGCSGLFEKDVVKIAPVPEFDNKIEVHELWSKSVGSGSGTWYTLLAPAVDSKYVFAAGCRAASQKAKAMSMSAVRTAGYTLFRRLTASSPGRATRAAR